MLAGSRGLPYPQDLVEIEMEVAMKARSHHGLVSEASSGHHHRHQCYLTWWTWGAAVDRNGKSMKVPWIHPKLWFTPASSTGDEISGELQ